MGISDWYIAKVKKVTDSWLRCPNCTTYCLICEIDKPFTKNVYYCPNPNCPTEYFDLVEDFFTDEASDIKILEQYKAQIGTKQ